MLLERVAGRAGPGEVGGSFARFDPPALLIREERVLIKDGAAEVLLEDQLAVVVRALDAIRDRLTIEEHVHVIRAAANASAALGDGDPERIGRSLSEMDDAAAVLAFAVRRRATGQRRATR